MIFLGELFLQQIPEMYIFCGGKLGTLVKKQNWKVAKMSSLKLGADYNVCSRCICDVNNCNGSFSLIKNYFEVKPKF